MKFRTQLTLGVVGLITITSAIGVLAVITLYMTTNRTSATTRQIVDDLAVVQSVRIRVEQVVSAARGYLLAGDEEFRNRLAVREQELEQSLQEIRKLHQDPSVAAQLAVVEERLLEYFQATSRAARQRTAATTLAPLEMTFERLLEPRQRALDEAVTKLVRSERARLDRETAHGGDLLRRFSLALLLAWCAATGLSITLAVIVVRRSTAQFRRVTEAEAAAEAAAAARKQLLDVVAHDLMSPLNAIVLGLEVLQLRHVELPHVHRLRKSTERMQRLVNDLIDVSRVERGGLVLQRVMQAVAPMLDTIVDQFREAASRAGVKLRRDSADDLEAYVDRDRIFQILANLMGNAIRYARTGDEIIVRASRLQTGEVRFAVCDSGPGVPDAQLAHLFDAYTQGASGSRRGSLGLGLYICKTLVEAHGGRIGVDSVRNQGTTFWFDIPDRGAAAGDQRSAKHRGVGFDRA